MSSEHRLLAGRYVLEEPIGRGGMGEVWRATDTVLGREVAVKTIDLDRVPDEAGAARFEREAQVTAAMSHPNVVTVHDTGVEGRTAYLVMELLPGPSLAERLAQGPLPLEEVVDAARQVASALGAAHARGVVHRDIKPANVVRAADGRLRVLDFGITQLGESSGSQALTATHTVMGTAEYLAPEQATGGRVDGRADLYALGCVLYALLTGRPPFRGATPVATMMQHSHDPVPDVRESRPETPAWLAGLVSALLAKDPQDRPADAAAVLEAIERREAPGAASVAAATTTLLPASGAEPTRRLASPAPAAATSPPTAAAPPTPARSPERRGSSAPLWVLALVALAALALLAWYLLTGLGEGSDPATTPTSTPSTSAPATQESPSTTPPETSAAEESPTSEAPSPTQTPSETTADPQPVEDAGSALDDEVSQLRQDDVIDEQAAKVVQDPLKDADKALRKEDSEALVEARDALVEDYQEAVADGTYPAEAAQRLDPLVEDFDQAVDDYAGG
ncbi:serine/threonine protein kinase [Phycicoccus endophyticus]|uniref:non-specific serine/threonine protein kinase n=1 Tax=Phycicoccus endophyticus TaxID=1690220 RepID=A0A7G9R4G6_9MICO|nr:serine/threonine-protein kinase [Phycicoccus endophyticus]NHI18376.1 serine/threonine protein kinase [Phycicoccus endophyticus]QNN50491.1 serine/threonine protein kinase [Phycicoccus endophyticus]GGL24288.1 hypothetical protein GCM10012283_02990 [Phycicoccus endophyticus]